MRAAVDEGSETTADQAFDEGSRTRCGLEEAQRVGDGFEGRQTVVPRLSARSYKDTDTELLARSPARSLTHFFVTMYSHSEARFSTRSYHFYRDELTGEIDNRCSRPLQTGRV